MVLLVFPDIWLGHINDKGNISPDESSRLRTGALRNKLNSFVFNENVLRFYKDYFMAHESDEYDYNDIFNQFYIRLSDSNRISPINKSEIFNDQSCFLEKFR